MDTKYYCSKWEHWNMGKQSFVECPNAKPVVIPGFEEFKFFIHRELMNDDARKIVARIDKTEMNFLLPLHESSLWKHPLYYEISNSMPMVGEPKVEYPKCYLVVSVR